MAKRVLDVGNCPPDHAAIRSLLERTFGAEVVQAHGPEDALDALRSAALQSAAFDLVLVNRKLDRDYSDGIDVIRQIKSDEQLRNVPVMLITNYAEHQAAAVADGALYGFGKLELQTAETRDKLTQVLG